MTSVRLVTLLLVGLTAAPLSAAPPTTRPALAQRPHLVVAGLELAEGVDLRDDWLAVATQEALTWRLRRVPGLVVVPAPRVHQARRELHDDGAPAPPWQRVGEALGAGLLLSGRCGGLPGATRLHLSLLELGPQQTVRAATDLPAGRFFDVLDAATQWALDQLEVGELSPQVHALVFAPPSRSPSALEYYARAVSAARAGRFPDAYHYATRALSYDERYRPALALLIQLEVQSGQAVAVRYLRLLGELAHVDADPLDRAAAELGHAAILHMTGSFDVAYTRYENSLAMSYEHDAPYGQMAAINGIADLYLVRLLSGAAKLPEPQATLWTRQNLRWSAEWQMVGLELLADLGDDVATAPAASKLALTYERLEDEPAALALHKRALAAAQRCGSRRNQASSWLYIGQLHRRAARWPEALDATQRCLKLAVAEAAPTGRLALATIYQDMQRPTEALAQFEQAYQELRDGDDLANQLVCVRQVAELRWELGQPEAAHAALREAIEIAHALGSADEETLRNRLAEWQGQP